MTRKLLSLVMALMLALGLAGALAEAFEGFYDFDAPYGLDTDINLILTPDGHGRLINSSGSVSFDFTEEDGRLVPDSDQLLLVVNGDRALATVAGMSLEFVRRADVEGGEAVVGAWKIVGMDNNGIHYDTAAIGVSVEAVFYPSGAVSWHAVTDSDSTLAQGWGVDGVGFYMKNGDTTIRILPEDDTLTLVYPDTGRGEVTYTFVRGE